MLVLVLVCSVAGGLWVVLCKLTGVTRGIDAETLGYSLIDENCFTLLLI